MSSLTPDHLKIVEYCQKIYQDEYLREAEEFVDNEETECQCIMFKEKDRDRLIVCFRGSDSIIDWKMNFYMTTTEYPKNSGRQVHSGFLVQWLSVRDEVKRKLLRLIETHKTKEILFCGHSAGTICCIAAYALGEELRETQSLEVVTFGGPRFCDRFFQEYFDERYKCTRIVLDRDVICLCPFGVFGYHHVGKPIQIFDDCVKQEEPTVWQKIHWLLLGIPKRDFGIRDHFIFNYTAAISKFVQRIENSTPN